MHFTTIFALAAAFSGVIAAPAPMPQDGTVTAAGNNGGNRNNRPTTTTTRTTTRPTTTTTTKTTTTVVAVPTPTSTGLPRCVEGLLTFNIKARSLVDTTGNRAKSIFDGQFIVDVGGPASFDVSPRQNYFLSRDEGFITKISKEGNIGEIATVKNKDGGSIPKGDIVFLTPDASIAAGYSPLRCTGEFGGTLKCVANDANRKVAQVCGKFINFEATANANCQDEIAFDVVRTCQF